MRFVRVPRLCSVSLFGVVAQGRYRACCGSCARCVGVADAVCVVWALVPASDRCMLTLRMRRLWRVILGRVVAGVMRALRRCVEQRVNAAAWLAYICNSTLYLYCFVRLLHSRLWCYEYIRAASCAAARSSPGVTRPAYGDLGVVSPSRIAEPAALPTAMRGGYAYVSHMYVTHIRAPRSCEPLQGSCVGASRGSPRRDVRSASQCLASPAQ